MPAINRFLSDHTRGRCLMNRIITLSCNANRTVSPRRDWVAYGEDNLRKYRPCKMIRGKWSSPRRDTSVCILRQGKHRLLMQRAIMRRDASCTAVCRAHKQGINSLCAIVGASINRPISRCFAIDIQSARSILKNDIRSRINGNNFRCLRKTRYMLSFQTVSANMYNRGLWCTIVSFHFIHLVFQVFRMHESVSTN